MNIPPDKVDLVNLNKASNELTYAVLRDGVLIYVDDYEQAVRWLSWRYAILLDEEENLNHTYYRVLRKELRGFVSKA